MVFNRFILLNFIFAFEVCLTECENLSLAPMYKEDDSKYNMKY